MGIGVIPRVQELSSADLVHSMFFKSALDSSFSLGNFPLGGFWVVWEGRSVGY